MQVTYRNKIIPFEQQQLEAIAKVLGDTDEGLTGPQIGHALLQLKIPDPTPSMTKWKRLYNALAEFQNKHEIGNHVVKFVNHAMNPSLYTANAARFRTRRDRLNPILALCGMQLGEDGRVRRAPRATTLDEALQRAGRMNSELSRRQVHSDVLRFCKAEVIQENNFHAVLEAMKSVTSRLRNLSGSTEDGAELVDYTFGVGQRNHPRFAINLFRTKTQRGEHNGFISLLKGLYGMVRNPLAHEPKIEWEMTEQDALDILTTLSMVQRKLDKAYEFRPVDA